MAKRWFLLGLLLATQAVADTKLSLKADSSSISIDDNLTVRLRIESDGDLSRVGEPRIVSKDFDALNSFSASHMVSSQYVNGKFSRVVVQELIYILRPKHEGTLRVDRAEIVVDGQNLSSNSIAVQVVGSGVGVASGYSGSKAAQGSDRRPFFVRAEASKVKVYKGEQLVVGYYLYRKVRTGQMEVKRYPSLGGFLKEDLEMPIVTNPMLNWSRTTENGSAYEKALLTSYAAYPLKEGKLQLDPMELRVTYAAPVRRGGSDDEDDPFQMLFQNFQATQVGSHKSEPVFIEVLPLPAQGKPSDFSGVVGDFQVNAEMDRIQVQTGESVTLKIRVEGQGNLAGMVAPKLDWPKGLEQFESKTNSKTLGEGRSERVFEYLLIPRSPGVYSIPQFKLAYFDPASGNYVEKLTPSLQLTAQGEAVVVPAQGVLPSGSKVAHDTHDNLKDLAYSGGTLPEQKGLKFTQWVPKAMVAAAILLVLASIVTWRMAQPVSESRLRSEAEAKQRAHFKRVSERAQEAIKEGSDAKLIQAYEALALALFEGLDVQYKMSSRSMSRAELGRFLVQENQMQPETWKQWEALLEYAETVRFAATPGVITYNEARSRLTAWVEEGEKLMRALQQRDERNRT